MDTETMDKLYLEWSLITKARTWREVALASALAGLLECAEAECVGGSSHEPIERAKAILLAVSIPSGVRNTETAGK